MFIQLILLCCLWVYWRLWCRKQSISEPPELSGGLPFVGHTFLVLGDGIKRYKTVKSISEECLEKGGAARMNLGPRKVYVVADPEDCLTILNSCLEKPYIYTFVKQLFGNGILISDENTWKNHRKLLNPAFNKQVLNGFIEFFNTQSQSLVDQFGTELEKPFDHEKLLRINNLETAWSTTAGIDASEYNDIRQKYLPRYERVIKRAIERLQKFWLHSDFIYNMTQENKKQDEDLKFIIELSKSVIQKKKIEKANLPKTEKKEVKFKAFVDYLLDLASDTGCFTDEEIREETDNIISAAHDTIATCLTYVLTVLGSHTEVQEKAYNEILLVLGNLERNIVKEDLIKLEYVEAILKETLRFYPVGPGFFRRVDKDIKLKNYTLKANAECGILIYGLHRHKIWGPDADQFRPERWLDKEKLPDPKYFGAFGMGRRACIGKAYAMMSMKITLAHVLQKYRISSDISKMVEIFELLARPVSGHFITLAVRNT